MHVGTPPRLTPVGVGLKRNAGRTRRVRFNYPQQSVLLIPLATSDAGALWGALDRSGHGTRICRLAQSTGFCWPAVSERISMRQPVSLLASRAFWPSLPMAKDSW